MTAHKLDARIWLLALVAAVLLPALALAGDNPLVAGDRDVPTAAEASEPEAVDAPAPTAGSTSDASCQATESAGPLPLPAFSASAWIPGPVAGGCGGYPGCIGACAARGTPGDPCVCQCACEC